MKFGCTKGRAAILSPRHENIPLFEGMSWFKLRLSGLAVSSYHSTGILYDLFQELSFSTPVMPLWLSGGEAPLLSLCNLSGVLPFTVCYSQPLTQMPMYLQTSRLRPLYNKNVASQVLLHALCETRKASAVCCFWHKHHTLATQQRSSHWSKANMITANDIKSTRYNCYTTEWSSTEASWWKLLCTLEHTLFFFKLFHTQNFLFLP